MLPESITLLLMVLSVVSGQMNGEFWWLNNDITKLKRGTVLPPKFDDVNELDTDETAKIIFRDGEHKEEKSLKYDKDTISAIHFKDETELTKPFLEFDKLNVSNKLWKNPLKQTNMKTNNTLHSTEDEFRFVFPSDDKAIWLENEHKIKNKEILAIANKNSFLPENICTFIKKSECIHHQGTLYEPWMKPDIKMSIPNTKVICCILPMTTTPIAKIIFPDNFWGTKRLKRSSEDGVTPALKQRNTLMTRKYALSNQKVSVTTPSKTDKFANSDEYLIDPYWNIKNPNIRNPDTSIYQDPDTASDYGSPSYSDDYTVELPKPGLIGLYSDHKQAQSTWIHSKHKDYYYDSPDSVEEEEFETSFGYSTIDPRRDHRLTSKPSKPFRLRPLKLTAVSSRLPVSALQNPTITFHSNPDFQVLQGFKLLNLMRNKNRIVRRTAENNQECADNVLTVQEKPAKLLNHLHNNQEPDLHEIRLKQKLYNQCGKTQTHSNCESNLEQGVVEFGNHPWIALLVLTKSEHNILCYATLVHSRVAVSIADCVSAKSPGEVSIITGVQNLDEDLAQSQRRMATILLDPDYTPGNLDNNLALLHWLRPLIFDAKIQPACLGEPDTESNCVFVGWGGYDQEMHPDLRWQQASILSPQNCNKRLSKLQVSDALCAAVESRGTVTGVGGPLLCKTNERWSIVGIAVWRNDVVIVLPQREWVIKNMMSLDIQ